MADAFGLYGASPRHTFAALGSGATFIEGSARVDCITVANTHAANPFTAIFRDNDNDILMRLVVSAGKTVHVKTPWIAENGLKADAAGAALRVTVFHTSDGV